MLYVKRYIILPGDVCTLPIYYMTCRHNVQRCSVSRTTTCITCIRLGRSCDSYVQSASGIYGMVAAPDKTSLLHPVVGRFTTGQTIRVVRPAEVLTAHPFKLSESKCCGLRLTYDVPCEKSNGNLTVRVCW